MPFHTCTSKANPPRKPIVFPTICTGRVQRQPRRMPSPKTPNKAAIAQESRKEMISRSAFYNTLAACDGECVGVHGGCATVNPNTFRLLCFSHNRSDSLDNVISTDACFLHQFVRRTGARH